MKKFLFLIFISTLLASCTLNKTTPIFYKPLEKSRTYLIEIPKKYDLSLQVGNSYSYLFTYKNGAYFFVSEEFPMAYDKNNSPIIDDNFNIDSILNRVISSKYGSIPSTDTIIYFGQNESFFWKWICIYNKYPEYLAMESYIDSSGSEIINYIGNPKPYNFLFVGYSHVLEKDKELFDKCILSLKCIKDTTLIRDHIITKFLKHEKELE